MRGFVLKSLKLTLFLFSAAVFIVAQDNPPQPAATANPVKEALDPAKPGLPTAVPASVDPKAYKLGPEDVIQVKVWREPELSGMMAVRPDGKITMPMIGEVAANDVTPEQLAENITKRLSEFINHPEVMVSVQAVRSKRYYITGEVNRSGAFPMPVPTTVLEALTHAGGFRDFANKKKITVIRGDKRFKFNYNDVIKGKKLEQNILLENGDYIVVP